MKTNTRTSSLIRFSAILSIAAAFLLAASFAAWGRVGNRSAISVQSLELAAGRVTCSSSLEDGTELELDVSVTSGISSGDFEVRRFKRSEGGAEFCRGVIFETQARALASRCRVSDVSEFVSGENASFRFNVVCKMRRAQLIGALAAISGGLLLGP